MSEHAEKSNHLQIHLPSRGPLLAPARPEPTEPELDFAELPSYDY